MAAEKRAGTPHIWRSPSKCSAAATQGLVHNLKQLVAQLAVQLVLVVIRLMSQCRHGFTSAVEGFVCTLKDCRHCYHLSYVLVQVILDVRQGGESCAGSILAITYCHSSEWEPRPTRRSNILTFISGQAGKGSNSLAVRMEKAVGFTGTTSESKHAQAESKSKKTGRVTKSKNPNRVMTRERAIIKLINVLAKSFSSLPFKYAC